MVVESRMSRVLEELRTDHDNMAIVLALLEEQCALLEAAGSPDYDLVSDVMDYIVNYPDRCHHPKENLVFERLMAHDPDTRPALEVLLREHDELTRKSKELSEVLDSVAQDIEVPRAHVVGLLRNFVAANRHHMESEEASAFSLAATSLSAADWSEIDAAVRMDDPLFGGEVAERYRVLHQAIMSAAS